MYPPAPDRVSPVAAGETGRPAGEPAAPYAANANAASICSQHMAAKTRAATSLEPARDVAPPAGRLARSWLQTVRTKVRIPAPIRAGRPADIWPRRKSHKSSRRYLFGGRLAISGHWHAQPAASAAPATGAALSFRRSEFNGDSRPASMFTVGGESYFASFWRAAWPAGWPRQVRAAERRARATGARPMCSERRKSQSRFEAPIWRRPTRDYRQSAHLFARLE